MHRKSLAEYLVQGTSPVVTDISFVAILTSSFLQGKPLVTVGANNQRINEQVVNVELCSYFLKNAIYFLFLAALGLCCYAQAFSSCGEPGLHSNCSTPASHCGGFSYCKAWALGSPASIVGAHRLSRSAVCGIFLDQGSNLCPLHQQVDSQPLDHQGSPELRSHSPALGAVAPSHFGAHVPSPCTQPS